MDRSIAHESGDGLLEQRHSLRAATDCSPTKTNSSYNERHTSTTEAVSARKEFTAPEPTSSASQTFSLGNTASRRRQQSLRKTALLGDNIPVRSSSHIDSPNKSHGRSRVDMHIASSRRKSDTSPTKPQNAGSSAVHMSNAQRLLASSADDGTESSQDNPVGSAEYTTARLPLPSPPGTYASTTDEETDFAASLTQTALHSSLPSPGIPPASAYPPSYRSSKVPMKSPLPSVYSSVQSGISTEEQLDYSETAKWGWVVLISTWIVFVVGMGSCLGVWSWAWDVGETPYAPPEFEDDDTLPIVGYYPALMILTGAVMSWVWVVVAWVGMKYFRHAKMAGEEDR